MADAPNYALVGKRVRVHLYTREGLALGTLEGRVADVAAAVPVGRTPEGAEIRKDLAYVVDILPLRGPDGEETPYRNSAGTEGEGWFALQDLTVLDSPLGDRPGLSLN
ncbi:MAG: hypothetical protein ACK41D_09395 [Rubricoccaceae bacterium]